MSNMIHETAQHVNTRERCDVDPEKMAYALFERFLDENKDILQRISGHGDGRCGIMVEIMQNKLCGPKPVTTGYRKKPIKPGVKKQVLERDMYRCKYCYTHIDLCVDHIIPEALGGKATLDNLQTLCRPCNSRKGKKL